ncbi:hypothetical protein SIL81_03870 [Xanthomonas campestris pv. incanae]|uniref:hypothetical protein n=1 Tax=Xanthomonas TaxID=338 RepID=UPI0009BDE218|nr:MULTISPECIES: hypothetical protein [Xanthomonas]MCC8613090.1 hypothetical protein [Xanthomonas euvesicatoria pv. euvesicatoria]MDX6081451.1 hypothetical protein [Xanthomonas campestris pv. incanae]MDX6084545.1 hypothetical protein [Xanthomonas campestris pv. incanae]MDX6138366.1 hypothetical protein [Xanthomonas campestris pv. incanae]
MRLCINRPLPLAILTAVFLMPTLAFGGALGTDKKISDLISLFSSGVEVEQSQVERLIGTDTADVEITRDEPLRRHYRVALDDPKSQVTALSFGTNRNDEGSQVWNIAALTIVSSDTKAPGCEKYRDIVKKYGFVEGIREPRSVVKGAAWTQPATSTKGPYKIFVSTTDVTSPCVSGLTVSKKAADDSSSSAN